MKTEKRFLGILLTLALMLGLMPGMNTKVLAETATYKVSVTITNLTKSSTNDPWQSTGAGFPKYIEVSTEAGGSTYTGSYALDHDMTDVTGGTKANCALFVSCDCEALETEYNIRDG